MKRKPPTKRKSAADNGLLKVGIGHHHAPGNGACRHDVAGTLVAQTLDGIDPLRFPARLLLLLATADWCDEPDASLPREIRAACAARLGYEVPLIGGSMSSLFYFPGNISERIVEMEQGLILVAICSEHLRAVVAASKGNPHLKGMARRREEVKRLVDELKTAPGCRLGAASHALIFTPGIYLDQNGCKAYEDNELHREIVAAFGLRHWVVGAASANAIQPTVGYQFANDRVLESGLAIALVETDLATGTAMGHGFSTVDEEVCVDRLEGDAVEGYVVTELDGMSAAQRLGSLPKIGGCANRTVLAKSDGDDLLIVCDLLDTARPDHAVRLNRKVRKGDRLVVLETSTDKLFQNCRRITRHACAMAGAQRHQIKLLLDFTCSGRSEIYESLGKKMHDTADVIRKVIPGVPVIGGFAAGEFGADSRHQSLGNNLTYWVNCLADAFSLDASTRLLQRKLLTAADCLRLCESPTTLMSAALKGACDAGATGGQICIVDQDLGRILGMNHGCAHSIKGKGDWSKVAMRTDRNLPDAELRFPRNLLEYSMPANFLEGWEFVASVPKEVDILTLIAWTHRALFVTAGTDGKFHCNVASIQEGGIGSFLAMPLVGSNGKTIATLQLGMAQRVLDRESFGLWVGYSQKVAAALQQAQEREERKLLHAIGEIGDKLIQKTSLVPEESRGTDSVWCHAFLKEIKAALPGVDDVHIRVLRTEGGVDRYHLVAAVGELAGLREKARKVTGPDDGSLNLRGIGEEGNIMHTHEMMHERNANLKPGQGKTVLFRQFMKKLDEIPSSAILTIRHEGRLWGSITIDSRQPYYFTKRRQRLAKAVATVAANVVAKHEHDALEHEKKWLFESLAEIKAAVPATTGRQFAFEELLRRICDFIKADTGSLFLKWAPSDRLILHATHNWFRDMAGKVSYQIGEGWIGGIGADPGTSALVESGESTRPKLRKCYHQMIPKRHRVARAEDDYRAALVLRTRGEVIGVAAFHYFKTHQSILREEGMQRRIREFLEAISGHVALAVESAKLSLLTQRHQRNMAGKEKVAGKLVENPGAQLALSPVLETIRTSFSFERVSFWTQAPKGLATCEESLTSGQSTRHQGLAGLPPIVGKVWKSGKSALHETVRNNQLVPWPRASGIDSLFVVAVPDAGGQSKGVLTFANRLAAPDHPFNTPDLTEQSALEDIARLLGAALGHRDREEQQVRDRQIEEFIKQVDASREREKQATAMSDAFQDVAHQIKSPLAEAGRRVDEAASHYNHASTIGRDLQVIRGILDRSELTAKLIGLFSSLAKGDRIAVKGTVHTAVDLVRMAGGICENQRPRISERRNILIRLNADSFYKHTPSTLEADGELLRQALNNLMDNAIKYSYPNTVIGVSAGISKSGIFFIAVTNKGLPINTRETELVKQRNWRGEKAKLVTGEGSGLGLWIVDKVMAAQGGQLLVLPTRPNDGITEVRLVFPFNSNQPPKHNT